MRARLILETEEEFLVELKNWTRRIWHEGDAVPRLHTGSFDVVMDLAPDEDEELYAAQKEPVFSVHPGPGAGKLMDYSTHFALDEIRKVREYPNSIAVYIWGDVEPIWIYGDTRQQFMGKWREWLRNKE